MPRLNVETHKKQIEEALEELELRNQWANEMIDNPNFPGLNLSGFKMGNIDVDGRDIPALANLIPLVGVTPEQKKANYQKTLYDINMAFMNNDVNEAHAILDMMFNFVENFKEEDLDYTKPEDVYKAIVCGVLNQCVSTKRKEFHDYFYQKYDTPEKQEAYYFADNKTCHLAQEYIDIISKKYPVPATVTLITKGLACNNHEGAIKFADNIYQRDMDQRQRELEGNDEIIPLEIPMPKEFNIVNDPKVTSEIIRGNREVGFFLDTDLADAYLVYGSEGSNYVDATSTTTEDAIFINGKTLAEYAKGTKFASEVKSTHRKIQKAALLQAMVDPEATIEICKLIPQGNNQFKKYIVPIHRDFTNVDPEKQKIHDKKFNEYMKKDYNKTKQAKIETFEKIFEENSIKFEMNKFAKETEAKYYAFTTEEYQAKCRIGATLKWQNYDQYEINGEEYLDFETKYNILQDAYAHYIHTYQPKYADPGLEIIDARQCNGLAMLLAGKDASIEKIVQTRLEISKAFQGTLEECEPMMRRAIEACKDFKLEEIDFADPDKAYNCYSFMAASSIISNIFEANKKLENEYFKTNPSLKNDLSLKSTTVISLNAYICGKIMDNYGGYCKNLGNAMIFTITDSQSTDSSISTLETERMHFDILQATIGAKYSNKNSATITMPFFLSGNACGGSRYKFKHDDLDRDYDFFLSQHSFKSNRNEYNLNNVTLDEAPTPSLQVLAGESFFSNFATMYATNVKDGIEELSKANGDMDEKEIAERSLYIGNKLFKDLVEEKVALYVQKNNIDLNSIAPNTKRSIRSMVRNSLMAEALNNPDKTVTMITYVQNEQNVLEPRTVLLKKDYTPVIENAKSQHSRLDDFLHIFGRAYPEGRIVSRVNEAEKNYKDNDVETQILLDFKNKNQEMLLRHQAEYSTSSMLQKIALKELYPNNPEMHLSKEEIKLKEIRTEMLNKGQTKYEPKSRDFDQPSNKPKLEKKEKTTSKLTEALDDKKDNYEQVNFDRKFKKVEIDLDEDSKVEEIANKEIPDSPESSEYKIDDYLDDEGIEI